MNMLFHSCSAFLRMGLHIILSVFLFGLGICHAQSPDNSYHMGRILVLGDRSAFQISEPLRHTLQGTASVDYIGLAKVSDGFIRGNWSDILQDTLIGREKPFAVIVILSYNGDADDGIVELNGQNQVARTDWETKVTPLLQTLKAANIPFLWVGSPPVPNEMQNNHIEAMNITIRSRLPANAAYVDISTAFSDEDGDFTSSGADIEGRIVALRDKKGHGFTPAGARKAAYYINMELDQLYRSIMFEASEKEELSLKQPENIVITGTSSLRSDSMPLKRFWTVQQIVPEGALLQGSVAVSPDTRIVTLRTTEEGLPPPFKMHRADDMRWKE